MFEKFRRTPGTFNKKKTRLFLSDHLDEDGYVIPKCFNSSLSFRKNKHFLVSEVQEYTQKSFKHVSHP